MPRCQMLGRCGLADWQSGQAGRQAGKLGDGGAILPPGIGADGGGDGDGGCALACTPTTAAERREIAAMRAGDEMGWTAGWSQQPAGEVGPGRLIGCTPDPP